MSSIVCPICKSEHVKILDKGIRKVVRFLQGNNRVACCDCYSTWRELEPNRRLKLKRKRRSS
ncbi:MAG: hypothetical protein V1913_07975 [Fibrobacterota bacterium]